MQKIHDLSVRLIPFFKNKYAVTLLLFLVWMMFFDRNNVISQVKLSQALSSLEERKQAYKEKIVEVKADKEDLLTNTESLEKFAREKYWMKKDNEDIFVILPAQE